MIVFSQPQLPPLDCVRERQHNVISARSITSLNREVVWGGCLDVALLNLWTHKNSLMTSWYQSKDDLLDTVCGGYKEGTTIITGFTIKSRRNNEKF